MNQTILELFREKEAEAEKDFFTFLQFPSISTDPSFTPQLLACADWLSDYLTKMGFEVEKWPTNGHPILFAQNLKAGPSQPTLLLYNHYDVQPVDPIEKWTSPPFEPILRQGEIYARGAQDNKGQCFYTLQALKLMLERDGKLPINIKLCIEGEEESGSSGLSEILSKKKKALQSDYVAIVDVGIPDRHTPSVTLGVRGLVSLDVEVTGSTGDLHSGSHGGLAYNPIRALVEILSHLRDEKGKVTIPGFYDDVKKISPEDLSRLTFDLDESKYKEMFGTIPSGGETDLSYQERAWLRPTLEINGISGGYSGPGVKTVIPSKAYAKISCRLVPDQEPKKIGKLVKHYIESKAPPGISVKAHVHEGRGKAVRVQSSSKVVKAFAEAFSEIFNKPCRYIFEGASIPISADLANASGGEMVLVGLGLSDDQIHAPNEHFGWDRIEKGVCIIARAIELLASK